MVARNRPPVETNQILETNCVDLNHSGAGVARHEGFTLFVPGILPGEQAKVRVGVVRRNYADAQLIQIKKNSPQRVEPRCRYFGRCGGCTLQHFAYAEQLAWKKNRIEAALQRIGGFTAEVSPVLGMEKPWRYRNKAVVRLEIKNERPAVGFLESGSHRLVDIDSCPVQHKNNEALINNLRTATSKYLKQRSSPAGQELPCREVVLRTSFSGEHSLLALIAERTCGLNSNNCRNVDEIFHLAKLVGAETGVELAGISLLGPGSEMESDLTLAGRPLLEDKIGFYRFRISPRAFFQVNPFQAGVLFEKASALAESAATVLDLYCGTGTFTLNLARSAQHVIGIDVEGAAIEDARFNASANGVKNVEFIHARAEDFPAQFKTGIRPLTIFLNPPRTGCSKTLLLSVSSAAPDQVIYVSCDPGTMARDLKALSGSGYKIISVQPVDMFPHTTHVETVVLMSRVE